MAGGVGVFGTSLHNSSRHLLGVVCICAIHRFREVQLRRQLRTYGMPSWRAENISPKIDRNSWVVLQSGSRSRCRSCHRRCCWPLVAVSATYTAVMWMLMGLIVGDGLVPAGGEGPVPSCYCVQDIAVFDSGIGRA